MSLESLGWNDHFQSCFSIYADQHLIPGRIAAHHKGGYVVFTEHGELLADIAGKLHYRKAKQDLPVVGDWVALKHLPDEKRGNIRHVLPRLSKFSRKAAGEETHEQIIAANIDTALIVTSINADYSLNRIERYTVLAHEASITPVILLSKADLSDEIEATEAEVRAALPGIDVISISCKTGTGIDALSRYLTVGKTASLLGSSGVGKSTLVNYFLGTEKQAVNEIRESDGEGRHTTTHRELILLPQGGLIIDTPGMREVQLWHGAQGVQNTFTDLETMALSCRFTDCKHETEPGCAVKQAIADGTLAAERFESFKKLQSEAQLAAAKHDARVLQDERKKTKKAISEQRKQLRDRNR